jgi:hypothetical protein
MLQSMQREIQRRIDRLPRIQVEPKLLHLERQPSPDQRHVTTQPYFYRMKTVDDVKFLGNSKFLGPASELKGRFTHAYTNIGSILISLFQLVDSEFSEEDILLMHKVSARPAGDNLRSYFMGLLSGPFQKVDASLVSDCCDYYEHARFHPAPYGSAEYASFLELLKKMRQS